jgi:hypothetical protein
VKTVTRPETTEKRKRAKLSVDKVLAIRRAEGTLAKIAQEYGVTIGIAHGIRSGKTYQALD